MPLRAMCGFHALLSEPSLILPLRIGCARAHAGAGDLCCCCANERSEGPVGLPGHLKMELPPGGTDAACTKAQTNGCLGSRKAVTWYGGGIRPQESVPRTLSAVDWLCCGTVAEQQAMRSLISAWPPCCWRCL
jgi:hypothetical protein